MNKKNLTHFEKRLMEERARVMKELGYYDESFNATLQSSDGDLSSYSFHMADQGPTPWNGRSNSCLRHRKDAISGM
mgnify:CR=1 FL=1